MVIAEQILNIQFMKDVENYPVLYNYKLSGYSRKYITEKS